MCCTMDATRSLSKWLCWEDGCLYVFVNEVYIVDATWKDMYIVVNILDVGYC